MMHQVSKATPQYGRSTASSSSSTIDKCDIWDPMDADTHHQFVSGQVYPDEHDDAPDRWKIKLHRDPFDESGLPSDVTGYQLFCTDADDETYTETIQECNARARHVYLYIPQESPAIFIP